MLRYVDQCLMLVVLHKHFFIIFSIFAFQFVIFAEKLMGNLIKFRLMFMDEMASIAKNVKHSINMALAQCFPGLALFERGSNLN